MRRSSSPFTLVNFSRHLACRLLTDHIYIYKYRSGDFVRVANKRQLIRSLCPSGMKGEKKKTNMLIDALWLFAANESISFLAPIVHAQSIYLARLIIPVMLWDAFCVASSSRALVLPPFFPRSVYLFCLIDFDRGKEANFETPWQPFIARRMKNPSRIPRATLV